MTNQTQDTYVDHGAQLLLSEAEQAIINKPAMTTTTNAKHTPGPWTVRGFRSYGDGIAAFQLTSPTRTHLASVHANGLLEDNSEAEANAALIASAPQLAAENAALREALADCITEPGAMAERSHEYALKRLASITKAARAILAKP